MSGSGKTTLSQTFNALGYEAYNIEHDDYGLFMMVRRDTGERYLDYDNTDLKKVANSRWVCDVTKLKKLLDGQKTDLAFYCGTASDNIELMPLFDFSIVLHVSPKILDKRLMVREGTDDYANTPAGRQKVLSRLDEFEKAMIKAGMIVVDANGSPEKVAKDILKIVS